MDIDRTVPTVHLHIGGQALQVGGGGTHDHVFPATGEVQGPVPLASPADVDAAVQAAHAAFPAWRAWRPADRRQALVRLAALMKEHTAELARLEVLDNGMTHRLAGHLVGSMAAYTEYYAGWADKIEGRVTTVPAQQRELAYTIPEPYGVVGIILTWNGPLISVGMKVIPALAAGNTVVVKPSELTPYATEYLMGLIREAGIPDGVVNLVLGGPEAGEALVRHPLVQKVSFTGGPTTARKILNACAESLKPAVLELGGKSANLVFPDADLDRVTVLNTSSVFETLAGQGCAIPSRLLVHESVYDQVAERVVARARSLRFGDPFDPSTNVSAVVTKDARDRILGMVDRARSSGAGKLLAGGGVPGDAPAGGFYVEPTVFGDVDPGSELAQVEVFGPVLSLLRFSTEEEAIAIANGTSYGLASYINTRDIARIHRLAAQLHAGGVYVNGAPPVVGCELPFGGVGISGYGREGGLEGLLEFVRTKAVAIA